MSDSGSARSAPRLLLGSRPAPSTAATTSVASDVVSRGGVRASLRGRRALREGRHEGAWSALKDLLPEEQLDAFISKYATEIAAQARAVLGKMRAFLPGAIELVYDNFNALAIGFGTTERTSDAVFSIAVFPRWISLFFLHGANLADLNHLLKGKGKSARHIVLYRPETLDMPAVQALMVQALKRASPPFDPRRPNRIVIKSVSVKQRSRRPKPL